MNKLIIGLITLLTLGCSTNRELYKQFDEMIKDYKGHCILHTEKRWPARSLITCYK